MDKLDRMLRHLPSEQASPDLAARIHLTVHRRHRRRQFARWSGASLLGLVGLWLIWPGVAWLSSGAFYASGASWLASSVDYVNSESLDMLYRLWNGMFSAQSAIGSDLALSTWIGAVLLCCAIFLVTDARAWQPVLRSRSHGGTSTMLPGSIHT